MSNQPEALRLANKLERGTYLLSVERNNTAAELRRLHGEVERLRADAERYRWLRKESAKNSDFYSGDARWMVSREQGGMGQNFFGDKIDAVIDAALKEAK